MNSPSEDKMAALDLRALDKSLRKIIAWLYSQIDAVIIDLAALQQCLADLNIEIDVLAAPNASPDTPDGRFETARIDMHVFKDPPVDSLTYAYYFDVMLHRVARARADASECSVIQQFSDHYVYNILDLESYGLQPNIVPISELRYPNDSLGCLIWDSTGFWACRSDNKAASSPSVYLRSELTAAICLLYQQITYNNVKLVGPRRYLRRLPQQASVQATVITFLPHDLCRAAHVAVEDASHEGRPGFRLHLRRLGQVSLRVPGPSLPTFPAPAMVTEIVRWAGMPDPFGFSPPIHCSPDDKTTATARRDRHGVHKTPEGGAGKRVTSAPESERVVSLSSISAASTSTSDSSSP